MTIVLYCSISGLLLALALSLFVLKQRLTRRQRDHHEQSHRLAALRLKIDEALQDNTLESAQQAFGATLRAASLTTDLQRPRLENMAKIDKQAPEKYRILSRLAAQGMEVEDIAAVLGVSRIEAGQLLSLSQMANCGR